MKKSKKIIGGIIAIIVIVAIVLVIAINSGMVEKTPSAIKKTVVGEVYGQKITVEQVEQNPDLINFYSSIEQQFGSNPISNSQAKEQIIKARESVVQNMELDSIINKQIETLKLIPTQADMDKLVAEQKKSLDEALAQNGMTEAIYLQLKGMTAAQLNAQLEQQAKVQALLAYISKDINITENDAQIYYNENKDTQFTVQPGADVYQIVVSSKAEAEKLKAQYESEISGKNLTTAQQLAIFQKIASGNNIDSTKQTGGSLGYIPYNYTEFNKNFMTALDQLKTNGAVSGIVDSSTGSTQAYNVIFVDGVNTKVTVKSFDSVKDQIMETLKQQKVQAQSKTDLAQWQKEAGAKVYDNKLDYAMFPQPKQPATEQGQKPAQPQTEQGTTQSK